MQRHKFNGLYLVLGLAMSVLASACSSDTLNTQTQLGGAKDTVGDNAATQVQLIKCAQPLGVAALVEPAGGEEQWGGLPSPVPLLKLMMTRSNCFRVVDRGRANEVLLRERALQASGELEDDSNLGGGQLVAADYLISPSVLFQDQNAGGGGVAGVAAGILGGFIPGIGLVAGNIRTENLEAQTLLTLTNVRTGVQEAVAEGSARKRDISFGIGGGFLGGGGGALGGGGAYTSTDLGKIVGSAFLDSFNKLVASLNTSGGS